MGAAKVRLRRGGNRSALRATRFFRSCHFLNPKPKLPRGTALLRQLLEAQPARQPAHLEGKQHGRAPRPVSDTGCAGSLSPGSLQSRHSLSRGPTCARSLRLAVCVDRRNMSSEHAALDASPAASPAEFSSPCAEYAEVKSEAHDEYFAAFGAADSVSTPPQAVASDPLQLRCAQLSFGNGERQ